jgi:hypothetical protein
MLRRSRIAAATAAALIFGSSRSVIVAVLTFGRWLGIEIEQFAPGLSLN